MKYRGQILVLAVAIVALFATSVAVGADRLVRRHQRHDAHRSVGTVLPTPSAGGPTLPATASPSVLPETAAPAPSPTPAPGITPVPGQDVLLVPPAPFTQVPDATAGTGMVDAATAAGLDGGGTLSAAGLRDLGFRQGITRQWTGSGQVLVDLVYTFASADGAGAYVRIVNQQRRAGTQFTAVPAPAGSPAGAIFFTAAPSAASASPGAEGSTAISVFTVGRYAVVLGLEEPTAATDLGQLAALAALQARTDAGL